MVSDEKSAVLIYWGFPVHDELLLSCYFQDSLSLGFSGFIRMGLWIYLAFTKLLGFVASSISSNLGWFLTSSKILFLSFSSPWDSYIVYIGQLDVSPGLLGSVHFSSFCSLFIRFSNYKYPTFKSTDSSSACWNCSWVSLVIFFSIAVVLVSFSISVRFLFMISISLLIF